VPVERHDLRSERREIGGGGRGGGGGGGGKEAPAMSKESMKGGVQRSRDKSCEKTGRGANDLVASGWKERSLAQEDRPRTVRSGLIKKMHFRFHSPV